MAHISRRTFIGGTTAGIAMVGLAGSASILAQDDKPALVVGSTNYTEQFVLAEMMALLLEDADYPITVEHNIGGTAVIHEARNAGDIDVHVEYTGSGLTLLEQDVADLKDPDMSPQEVADL